MINSDWLDAVVLAADHDGNPAASEVDDLRTPLRASAEGFASLRPDVQTAGITWPKRGLHSDEAITFLRARDDGFATVDAAGFVRLPRVRPKTPEGRYAMLGKNGNGVSVNLEYLIQVGTTAELVLDLGWPGDSLDFERGEFDVLGRDASDRITLAVEAKARVRGADGLEKLARDWIAFARSDDQAPSTNAGRKYNELRRLCESGPVMVWLVAAGARWPLWAESAGGTVVITLGRSPRYSELTAPLIEGRQVLWIRAFDPGLHSPGTQGSRSVCSWFCSEPAVYSVHVHETSGGESTFALCPHHCIRVQQVYGD